MLAAITLDINWEMIVGVLAAIGGFGVFIGIIAWKAYRKFKSLSDHSNSEAVAKKEKLAKEQEDLRETLLGRYKELYELIKSESARDLKLIQDRLDRRNSELAEIEDRLRDSKKEMLALREENKQLVTLNLEFQTNKAHDAAQIRELIDTVNRSKTITKQHS